MLTLTLIHLTETLRNYLVDFYWTKCKGQISGWTRYTQQHSTK